MSAIFAAMDGALFVYWLSRYVETRRGAHLVAAVLCAGLCVFYVAGGSNA